MKFRVYNKTLNPALWDGLKLKKDIQQKLLSIAQDFYKQTELNVDFEDILLLGSSANYNWTDKSDVDLHILLDVSKLKLPEDYAKKFLDGLKYKWNTEHDVKIKNMKVEVCLQDINEKNRSNGVYSIVHDEWVTKPSRQKIILDKNLIKEKYKSIVKKIDSATKEENVEKLKALMKSIINMRNVGLDKTGEYSVENVVFKALRYNDQLKKLKDATNSIYDKKMSVSEKKM
jgi:hypothetical protein